MRISSPLSCTRLVNSLPCRRECKGMVYHLMFIFSFCSFSLTTIIASKESRTRRPSHSLTTSFARSLHFATTAGLFRTHSLNRHFQATKKPRQHALPSHPRHPRPRGQHRLRRCCSWLHSRPARSRPPLALWPSHLLRRQRQGRHVLVLDLHASRRPLRHRALGLQLGYCWAMRWLRAGY